MAKIVLSPLVTSMRGKLGNAITQVWKGIQTIRQMPAVIANPQSSAQAKVRSDMGEAYASWRALTDGNKATWDAMAEIVAGYDLPPGGINQLGPKLGGQMSGFNCFMSFAMACQSANIAMPTDAPIAEQRPGPPTGVVANYVSPNVTVTWTDPVVVEVGAQYRIWMRSVMGTYHKQIRNTGALALETIDLSSLKGALGKSIVFTVPENAGNEEIVVQMDIVNPSGLRSMGSNVPIAKLE
ncbi:hypothetical protein ES705_47346 [subsurface metagenome]